MSRYDTPLLGLVLGLETGMRRREFITLIGAAAASSVSCSISWPLAARAQQPERVRRIGALMQYTDRDPEAKKWIAALTDGLQQLGWTAGVNIEFDWRWAGPDLEKIERNAKELAAQNLDAVIASSTPTTLAMMQQTRTIPVLFTNVVDPVGSGFVASLSRPAGNITGFVNLEASVSGKYLEFLKDIAPQLARVAMFYNPATAPYAEIYVSPFKAAAAAHGVEPIVAPVHNMADLEALMATQARQPNGGMLAMPDGFNNANRAEEALLAARYKLPTIYPYRSAVERGGLISYGNDISDNYRRVAAYVDRIMKGEKPNDLPVQFPTKFELVINRKTAGSLGLEIPAKLLITADEVIE